MTKGSPERATRSALGEDSPVNSVAARLAIYAALAGAAGATVSLALRRHRKSAEEAETTVAHPTTLIPNGPNERPVPGPGAKANWPSPGARGLDRDAHPTPATRPDPAAADRGHGFGNRPDDEPGREGTA